MTSDARDLEVARRGAVGAPGGADPEAHAAFARIYDRHSAVVRALCRRHSSSEAETDDALQETFIRAFRMLDRVSDPDGLRSWLYQIAAHVCSERRRAGIRRRRHEQAALEHGDPRMNGRLPMADSLPSAAADRAEQLDRLTRALDELPDDERLAIHLYYLDPDPVAAADAAIGISRSAFYKLLARARDHLAAIMTRANA
jgi:RNA polymerase sigma-70 factor, ECF subfamily